MQKLARTKHTKTWTINTRKKT